MSSSIFFVFQRISISLSGIDKTTGRYTAQKDEIQKVIEKQQGYTK
ncbi:hypothetical protein [Lacrimispora sp.]|nr:hypothetical protein [Lacrimispora sp.]